MSLLGTLSEFGSGYPPILPGIAIALMVALVLAPWVGGRLGTGRITAWLLLAAVGVILAITLTPNPDAIGAGSTGRVTCDLSRIGPAAPGIYLRRGDPFLNVLMLVPLGVIVGQLDRRQHRGALVLAAVALPFAIELTQAVVVPLGRACEGGDVFDNLAGLAAGLVIGATWRRARPRQPEPPPIS